MRAADVRLASNDFRVTVDLEDRELSVIRLGKVEWRTPIGIGTRKTPTPAGSYYLTELLMPNDADTVYGVVAAMTHPELARLYSLAWPSTAPTTPTRSASGSATAASGCPTT